LRQSLGLSHDPEVVFQSKDFAESGAKDGLRVGQDHADELAIAVTLVHLFDVDSRRDWSACHQSPRRSARSKRYSSMTTPTPRRPLSSKLRTTRPRQSSRTSASAPTKSAGKEMVKSTIEPTGISESTIWNSTPFAEIF